MALTSRTAGTVVTTSFFNDFYNLLTGVMQDQAVTFKQNLTLKGISSTLPTAPTGVTNSGTGFLTVGSYTYTVTYVSASGETVQGAALTVSTTSGNTKIALSAIPTGPSGTTARKIYRSKVGGGTTRFLLTTLADNVTVTYLDSTTDAALPTTVPPTYNTFGGSLVVLNGSGTQTANISNDGWVNAHNLSVDYGSTGAGYYIDDTTGTPQKVMYINGIDNDVHLQTSPTNHKLKITKDTGAYDIITFDASGASGATTINGSLTVSGATTFSGGTTYAGGSTFTTTLTMSGADILVSNNNALTFKDTTGSNTNARVWCNSSNNMVYKACTANNHLFQSNAGSTQVTLDNSGVTVSLGGVTINGTGDMSVTQGNVVVGSSTHATQINFNAGNSGSVRNPSGGHLDISAGGTGACRFYTNNNGTLLGKIDNSNALTLSASGTSTISGGGLTVSGGVLQVSTGDLYIGSTGNPTYLQFAAGNSGAMRNNTGGDVDITAGGSGGINFFTGHFGGSSVMSVDHTGNMNVSGGIGAGGGTISAAQLTSAGKVNMGYGTISKVAYGTYNLAADNTAYTFNHGMGATPKYVGVSSDTGGGVICRTFNSTNFTCVCTTGMAPVAGTWFAIYNG